ncbi:hypothetical protein RR48_02932 [Papilio machaon]|uniref:Uncharacterized protein n=1 Tax=Papilio machaon TaxID=76193 RepID=A0A0N0PBI0_PAPMA|nr:hypothetical protein RR48_02932 [Papilio machaon]
MKDFQAVLFCVGTLSIASSAPANRDSSAQASEYNYDYDNSAQSAKGQDPAEAASHYDAYISDVQAAAAGGTAKKGYSSGSGLRTIAVGSANQAKTALGNQVAAAYQAAYVAKNTLAQSAAQASATAQAALAGKQVILSGLEQQVRDAKVGLQGEEMQLQQAKRAAQAAAQAAQQAMHQVNVIQAALNAAQATSENANEAASQAAGELGAQTAMVGAARQRLHTLQEQLHGVRIDFEATQAAARKAQAAAQQAQANAAAAAAKAAAAGLASGKQQDASHEGTSHEEQRAAPEQGQDYYHQSDYQHQVEGVSSPSYESIRFVKRVLSISETSASLELQSEPASEKPIYLPLYEVKWHKNEPPQISNKAQKPLILDLSSFSKLKQINSNNSSYVIGLYSMGKLAKDEPAEAEEEEEEDEEEDCDEK